jgi:hypothetical protein
MSKAEIDPSALDDDALELVMAIIHLCGEGRWPHWARAVIQQQPDTRSRRQYARLLKRVWPHAEWQTRGALRTIARALDVEVPEDPPPTQAAKPQRPKRRTLWPFPSLGSGRDRDREPSRGAAAALPAFQQRQKDEAAARRHNRQPGIWQSARDLMDAIHPGRGP